MLRKFEKIADACEHCQRCVEESGGVVTLCLGHEYLQRVTAEHDLTADDERMLSALLGRNRGR